MLSSLSWMLRLEPEKIYAAARTMTMPAAGRKLTEPRFENLDFAQAPMG